MGRGEEERMLAGSEIRRGEEAKGASREKS